MGSFLRIVVLLSLFIPTLALSQPAPGSSVRVTSSALPTGASTSANQTTVIGHVDGVEGLLTTIDADTGTIAGAVSGSEMQVDVVTLPAVSGTVTCNAGSGTFGVGDGSGALTVDGTVTCNAGSGTMTVSGTVTADTELTAVAALGDDTANPTISRLASFLHLFDGTTWDRARGDSADGLLVNLGLNNDVIIADGGNSITVDGTVSAAQAGAWNVTNITGTVSLPTGASTSAKQDTVIGHVDGIEGLLATIDADTGTLAGAVSGSEIQVDVVAALPAGTNNIGDVDVASIAAGNNNIGDVDVASSALPTGASTSANQTTIIGHVDGLEAFASNVSGATQADDAAFTPATSRVMMCGAELDNTSPDSVDEGDGGALRMSSNRNLYVQLRDGANNERGAAIDASGRLSVSLEASNTSVSVFNLDAHDAPITLEPFLVGGRASTATPSAVSADGDLVRFWADRRGALKIVMTDDSGDSVMDGTNDALKVNVVAGGAGDGAIQDGASPSIEATVVDYTNSNPLAVRLTDTNGDYVAAGAGTQYTEDAAAAANPVGSALNLIRADSLSGLTTTDGDNVAARGTDNGELYVKHVDSIPATQSGTWNVTNVSGTVSLPTGASTAANQTTIIGHVDGIEGLLTTIDADTGTLAGAVSGSEMQVDVLTMPTVTVNSHAVTNAGTFAVQVDGSALTALQLIDDGVATTGSAITSKGMAAAGTDGTNARILKTDASGELQVDVLTMPTTTVTGTVTAGNTAGDVAHGTGDSGNPVKVGLKAHNALPTAEANNDRVNGVADLFGRQLVAHIDPAMQNCVSVNVTTTQTGTDVWDPGASKRIAVTSAVISSYGTTGCRALLWFGDNADTTYTAGTDQLLIPFNTVPSATVKPGMVFTPAHPVFNTTADRELHLTTDAGCSLDIMVCGYEY